MAADNGAFSGLDAKKFAGMLAVYREANVDLDWIACPDVVADADATFAMWDRWEPVINAFGFSPALVLQDGMTLELVETYEPEAVFVGGSTEFKLGREAREIVLWARREGKPVHMGRVNTMERINYAYSIGCTSIDGSGFSKWADIRIPLGLRWIREAMAPPVIYSSPRGPSLLDFLTPPPTVDPQEEYR